MTLNIGATRQTKMALTGLPQALYELGHDPHLNDQLSWLDFERIDLPPL
jgi:hypothetical protein